MIHSPEVAARNEPYAILIERAEAEGSSGVTQLLPG